jgi:hypothetical protein
MADLDEAAEEAGGYVAFNPNIKDEIHYDYRKIIEYCKEKGIEPVDMTIRELHNFIIAG